MKQHHKKTHGETIGGKTPEYNAWKALRRRCYDIKCFNYNDYGGRGIVVTDRWLGENGYVNFLNDMGRRPSNKHSIDRTNNDGNYEVSNCVWRTRKEQANNRRSSKLIVYGRETKTLSQWADELKVDYHTFWEKLNHFNFDMDKMMARYKDNLNEGINSHFIEYNGVKNTVVEWSRLFETKYKMFHARMTRHRFDLDEVVRKYYPQFLMLKDGLI